MQKNESQETCQMHNFKTSLSEEKCKIMKKNILFFALIMQLPLWAQIKEFKIDTLKLSADKALLSDSKVQKVDFISLKNFNGQNLTEFLFNQSGISFKENGFGSVSSPSFRGTTAQQTAVLWNGININSQFLGQSDFNTFRADDYSNIAIKYGSGGIQQSSGSIGGSVHLNSVFAEKEGQFYVMRASIGSFGTFDVHFKNDFKYGKWASQMIIGRKTSENNYKIPQYNFENLNGNYSNQSYNWNIRYQINNKNQLEFFNQFYTDERFFPIYSETQIRTKYQNKNFRNLLFWKNNWRNLESHFRFSRLEEHYSYFDNIKNDQRSSGGNAVNYDFKMEFFQPIFKGLQLHLLEEFQSVSAKGYNTGISSANRKTWVNALLVKSQITPKFYLETGFRKELIEGQQSPFLYSFALDYKPISNYQIQLKASKNYRLPTFNDLYWQPGGNFNLKAENSQQIEINQNFSFKNWRLNLATYAMNIQDLIKWMPTNQSYWSAINFDKVYSYGLESQLIYHKNWDKNHQLQAQWDQYFTRSQDQKTMLQIAYVPLYKSNLSFNFQYKKWAIWSQTSFQGTTYSTSDQDMERNVGNYFLQNMGINYHFDFQEKYNASFSVNNLFNQVFERASYYPMPLRNYTLSLKIQL